MKKIIAIAIAATLALSLVPSVASAKQPVKVDKYTSVVASDVELKVELGFHYEELFRILAASGIDIVTLESDLPTTHKDRYRHVQHIVRSKNVFENEPSISHP